jgi:isopenicillin N synthase-like dioxygenase
MDTIESAKTGVHATGYVTHEINSEFQQQTQKVLELWKEFCNLPQDIKDRYVFQMPGGYEYKGETERDYKENVHITLPYKPEQFWSNPTQIERDFFRESKKLIAMSFGYVLEIAKKMGIQKNSEFYQLLSKSIHEWKLRLLHYPKRDKLPKFLAASHPDKAGMTTHLVEDMPGLEIFWNGKWVPVHAPDGSVLAYPGLTTQFYTGCELKGLCHRVVPKKDIKKRSRYSIVIFSDCGNKYYDKTTLGAAQDAFPEGENYSIPYEIFKTYFVKNPTL